ncbi:AraC family transcriptional regulator [Pseudotamlana carrageenivorans]|uniref:HTH araC/xylS-type domain-containing protein n=1 Tax=Pseudotamlana carrageenivorans TaxID=2069432 RepID=A0A2I7SK03_9FLAO|nr:AraC family transcriptional regulator [Tamlana carrageenivorans]AUS06217.1 hypothetical protein C1A40_12495 [Tamlana carrageenivorans]
MKPELEHIPHKIDQSIYAYTYKNACFAAPWHYHEDYELTYIVKSSGIRHVGSSLDNFHEGDLVLIGKNVPHCWKNNNHYLSEAISYCVQWPEHTFKSFIANNPELQALQTLLNSAQAGIKFTNISFNTAIGKRLSILPDLKPEKIMIVLLDILTDLAANSEKELLAVDQAPNQVSDKTNSRTKAILNYIDQHYHQKITNTDMAKLTHMSSGAFCKYFKKQFKRPFTNYLNEFRIRKACISLRETNNTLLDISLACGYDNLSFFHRQFKKYVSMTPKAYRTLIEG